MNKFSNKSKLPKKLKIISIASAIVMCSTLSADVYRASANPVSRFFRNSWNGFIQLFRRSNNNTTTGTEKLTKTNGNREPLKTPKVKSMYTDGFGENPQNLLSDMFKNESGRTGPVITEKTKSYARPKTGSSNSTGSSDGTQPTPPPKPPRLYLYDKDYFNNN